MSQAKVLTQAEIDALLSSKPADEAVEEEPAKAVKVVPFQPSGADSSEATKATSPESQTNGQESEIPQSDERKTVAIRSPGQASEPLQDLLNELTRRLEQAEAATKRIDALEKRTANLNSIIEKLTENYQVIVQHLQSSGSHIRALEDNSQATPGYGLRKLFQCNQCDSRGNVASRIKCTTCGNEHWWGWWPKK